MEVSKTVSGTSRNNLVDLWKIIFTFCIATYHLKNAFGEETSLYIGVEFFFIISGYLLAVKCEYVSGKETAWRYTLNRIKLLYPHGKFTYIILSTMCFSTAILIGNFTGRNEYDFLKLLVIIAGTYLILRESIMIEYAGI